MAVQLAFASLAIAAKPVLAQLPPEGLAAIRAPAAALVLWAIALARGRWRIPRALVPSLLGLAVLGIAANQLLFLAGLARTTATTAVVLGTTIPAFTVGIAVALRREPATARRFAGVALALAGALVTIGGGASTSRDHLVGDLLIILNSLSYATYLVLGRAVVQRLDPLVATTWIVTFGALMIAPVGAPEALAGAPALDARAWLAVAWIVLVATVGTYALNAWALRRAPASLVAVYVSVQPLVTAALAAALLGERPGLQTALGGLLIAGGIVVVSRARA
jgi:drug/metabolite transporter (DMT)-like permease